MSLIPLLQGMVAAPSGGPGVHRYWRLYITANDGNASFMGVTEVRLRNGSGTVVSHTNATSTPYSSSSDINASNDYSRAWDNNLTDSGWLSATAASPQWTKVDLGNVNLPGPTEVMSFDLYGSWNAPDASPKDFELQWSDDNSTWTTAGAYTDETGWAANELRSFLVP